MGDSELKEVDFKTNCGNCKHAKKPAYMDPCNECLEVGMREGTNKPEFWEAK